MDTNSKQDSLSLRQMIMPLKSRRKKEVPLFHSGDESWDKNGYIFQCIPAHKEEACITIPELIPLVQHRYGDEIIKSFTPEGSREDEDGNF